MQEGVVAGYPVKDVRVRLYDGSYHTVDSSEMAFKLAGSLAMKQALEQAAPVLLEPIMVVTVSVPEDAVGDVIGDLNSRRGRPLGMEPAGGGMTEVKAEVPMAEMLAYAPDLRSITGGQGEFTMEFLRYEEVPGHLAGKVVARGPVGGGEGLNRPRRGPLRQSGALRSDRPRTRQPHPPTRAPTHQPLHHPPPYPPRDDEHEGHPHHHGDSACDVCGRTLLRGEHADVYLNGGGRRSVCELCTARALHEGWVREGTPCPPPSQRRARRDRRRSLLGRLRVRRRRSGFAGDEADDARGRARGPAGCRRSS